MIEFTLGRESGTDMPRLAVSKDGKTLFFGAPGSVPQGVSRLHCRVIVEDDSKITIEDVTDNNLMFVNGLDCKRKQNVGMNDTVELGACKYKLELDAILKMLSANQSFSIAHLEQIYEDYDNETIDSQIKQNTASVWRTFPLILSMMAGVAASIFNKGIIHGVLVCIAVLLAIVFFVLFLRKASQNPIETRKRNQDFREKYVCPNPACQHFLGMTPYKDLLKNKTCPFCRAKFTE